LINAAREEEEAAAAAKQFSRGQLGNGEGRKKRRKASCNNMPTPLQAAAV
jgi:hypothetical protein